MKTVHSFALMALAATTLASSAAVMNITVDDDGNYLQNGNTNPDNSLASKAFYESATGGTNNNPESNLAFLVEVLGNWNAHNADLPTAPTLALNVESIGGGSSYNAVAGYDYVVFHFGTGQAGQGGPGDTDDENGWWSAWYLGKAAHSFTAVPQEGDPLQNVGGFSSARYFNGRTPPDDQVPDGGTTIASLGVALLGLGGLRRLIKKD